MPSVLAQHTPGPWAWDSRNGKHFLVTCAVGAPHVVVLGWPCGIEDGTQFPKDGYGQADAALIAAAPELLAALKMSIAPVPEGVNWASWLVEREAAARVAIAKAEGR